MNKLIVGGGAIAAAMGIAWYIRMHRLSSELETVTKVSIWKVELLGLELRIDVLLKNPSGGSVTIKYPFVKMSSGGKDLASSEVKDIDFDIPAFGQKQLDPIYITLGYFTLATSVPELLAQYRKNGKITLTVQTITTLNNLLAYSKSEEIPIG